MIRKRLIALFLSVFFLFSMFPPTIGFADNNQELIPVTLTMFSNLSDRERITGFYRNNVLYISVDDICDIAGVERYIGLPKKQLFYP